MDIIMDSPTATMEDVIGRAQRGEADAFTALVDAHHAEMVKIAYVVCGDVELARDAAQSAWIKAWQGLPRLREPGRLRAWLIAIAANEARQAARSRRRRSLREVAMPVELPAGVPWHGRIDPAELDPGQVDLARALARLDPEDRGLIAMRYLAGLGSDEIARATGRSASGVRTRLTRLLARLRRELADA